MPFSAGYAPEMNGSVDPAEEARMHCDRDAAAFFLCFCRAARARIIAPMLRAGDKLLARAQISPCTRQTPEFVLQCGASRIVAIAGN